MAVAWAVATMSKCVGGNPVGSRGGSPLLRGCTEGAGGGSGGAKRDRADGVNWTG